MKCIKFNLLLIFYLCLSFVIMTTAKARIQDSDHHIKGFSNVLAKASQQLKTEISSHNPSDEDVINLKSAQNEMLESITKLRFVIGVNNFIYREELENFNRSLAHFVIALAPHIVENESIYKKDIRNILGIQKELLNTFIDFIRVEEAKATHRHDQKALKRIASLPDLKGNERLREELSLFLGDNPRSESLFLKLFQNKDKIFMKEYLELAMKYLNESYYIRAVTVENMLKATTDQRIRVMLEQVGTTIDDIQEPESSAISECAGIFNSLLRPKTSQ